jgi:molybdate transport repressor ModE-like protein
MKRISIKPVWTIQDAGGPPLPPRLLELLVQVQAQGSLLAACHQLGLSYRHAWDLVRQGEAQFQATLLHMERGKGSRLSALGEKLVWADHRINARLTPVLESLASELQQELGQLIAGPTVSLRLQATHGFAIEQLVRLLQASGLSIDHKYDSSTAAAAALHDGDCDVAGLHIPHGPLQDAAIALHARWFDADQLTVIDVATRRQGLMLAPGNPKKLYELADLVRPDVRFINRQAGSGTRFLLEGLLAQAKLSPTRIAGFEQGEFTHAAVAAYVASGMADVGFGLETPARHFRLDFLPLASERYFLLCRTAALDSEVMRALLTALKSAAFKTAVDALPGYQAVAAGTVTPLAQAFPPAAARA